MMKLKSIMCVLLSLSLTWIPIYGQDPFPMPPTLTPPCVNTHFDCTRWASFPFYYCEPSSEYSKFMIKTCPKACGACGMLPPATPPVEPPLYTEEVDLCKGIHCDPVLCSDNEVWSQAEGECCGGCVARPNQGCSPVYKPVLFEEVTVDGLKCKAKVPMITSSCFGACASAAVWLKNGEKLKECSCCEAREVDKVLLPVQCYPMGFPGYLDPEPYDDYYEYDLVRSCACATYGCMGEAKPHGEDVDMQMESYTDVMHNINAFNGH